MKYPVVGWILIYFQHRRSERKLTIFSTLRTRQESNFSRHRDATKRKQQATCILLHDDGFAVELSKAQFRDEAISVIHQRTISTK